MNKDQIAYRLATEGMTAVTEFMEALRKLEKVQQHGQGASMNLKSHEDFIQAKANTAHVDTDTLNKVVLKAGDIRASLQNVNITVGEAPNQETITLEEAMYRTAVP